MKYRDNDYKNTTEILSFELTNDSITPRNTTGSLWLYNNEQENKYINTSDMLYFRSRLVSVDVPEYAIILDIFDYFGGIY